MTGTVGSLALAGGLVAAVTWTLIWLAGAVSGHRYRGARLSVAVALAFALVACGALEWALVSHDFTVSYVAENGGRHVPLYFTVTSLWAALDGSILLWVTIVSATAVIVSRVRRPPQEHDWAMVTVGIVAVFFFALAYFAANPFAPGTAVTGDGPGPNPLLREHPAMGVHPPLLYAGYIALVVPFGLCVGALITGTADGRWLWLARRWTLAAWILLSAGIVLGAWWSYAVLGWGGYWAWDPVENASLMPWLTATAALHVTVRRRGRPVSVPWAVSLLSTSFLLVLVGTFLTRSGAVASVHSFTASPLGPMLLGFVLAVVAVSAGLLVWRGSRLGDDDRPHDWRSPQAALLANAVLLVTMAAVVLTGTLYPLVAQLVSGSKSTVGAQYYDHAALPVALAMMVVMGVGQLYPQGIRGASRLAIPGMVGLAVTAAVGLLSRPPVLAAIAFGVAAFVLAGVAMSAVRRGARRTAPGLLAHAGIAVICIGIAASSSYSTSTTASLAIGKTVQFDGYTARLVTIDRQREPDRMTVTARLDLMRDGAGTQTIWPRLRYYPGRDMTVGAPAIHSGLAGDVYATVTAVDDGATHATVRLAHNAFVELIWLGGLLLAVAGGWALARMHRRSTTPTDPSAQPTADALVST